MPHKLITTTGLGVLGIDPITAVYMLGMGAANEKKSNVRWFFFTFAIGSILIGAVLAAVFGIAAVDILQSLIPGDDSPFWIVLKFIIAIVILIWVLRKIFLTQSKKDTANDTPKSQKAAPTTTIMHITTGVLFAISCFTDPTYYAVILIGGESGNFFTAALLLTLWFVVSQFMAIAIYIAYELHMLDKLTVWVEQIKQKNLKPLSYLLYIVLIIIALALLADSGWYLFTGEYLF